MASVSSVEPPRPAKLKIMNTVVKLLVGRGWGPMTKDIMIMHWTGKKTGNTYSTPVARFEIDGQLFTNTSAGYKANFVDGGPAELVIDGKRRRYSGVVVDDAELVGQRMRSILDSAGPKHGARALGLVIEGEPSAEQLAELAAADRRVVIDFQPT